MCMYLRLSFFQLTPPPRARARLCAGLPGRGLRRRSEVVSEPLSKREKVVAPHRRWG